MKLRPYQIRAVDEACAAVADGERPVLVLPTGAGKTTIACEIIKRYTAKGKRVIFLAHRQELLHQARERLARFNIDAGIIQGGNTELQPAVNVASVQTLCRRRLPYVPDLFFVDEAHHAAAKSYTTVLDKAQFAGVIGLTATPARLDGKPLGDIFTQIIEPVTAAQLIEDQHLVPAEYYSTSVADLSKLKKQAGDYNKKQLYQRFNKKKVYSNVVESILQHTGQLRTIVFAVNIQHAEQLAEQLPRARVLHSKMHEADRQRTLALFANDQIQYLVNVAILTEGYDLPAIEAVALVRATSSVPLYLQMVGRGVRPAANKDKCVVLDYGENVQRHGFFEQERRWSLSGKVKAGDGVAPVKQCKKCYRMIYASMQFCPHCGADLRTPRQVVEAKLQKVIAAPDTKTCSVEELEQYREAMGYKTGWVIYRIKERSPNIQLDMLYRYAALKEYKRRWVHHVRKYYGIPPKH
jgi:superfamily II DNA or RNA helicase